MPHPTLYRYCRYDKSKRQLIGTGVRKNRILLNIDDTNFMGNVLVWEDRGNNEMSCAEDMNEIQEINPKLGCNQYKDHLDRYILTKSHADGKSR